MPRKFRKEYSGATYHVINRGNYRQPAFADDRTKDVFAAKGAASAMPAMRAKISQWRFLTVPLRSTRSRRSIRIALYLGETICGPGARSHSQASHPGGVAYNAILPRLQYGWKKRILPLHAQKVIREVSFEGHADGKTGRSSPGPAGGRIGCGSPPLGAPFVPRRTFRATVLVSISVRPRLLFAPWLAGW